MVPGQPEQKVIECGGTSLQFHLYKRYKEENPEAFLGKKQDPI
jgi:hypothetical protein